MDMVNITGHRVVFTKVNSKMALDKVMEYGRKIQDKVINMKEIIFMIKKKVMVYLHGNKVTFIKEIIIMILDRVMDKCIGLMEVIIKDNGDTGSKKVKGSAHIWYTPSNGKRKERDVKLSIQ